MTVPHPGTLEALETPCLLLDKAILVSNARRFLDLARARGVRLRPHLKTCKSIDVANILTGDDHGSGITVSTLAEAEYFAGYGYRDILYAVGMAPNKFGRAARIQSSHEVQLLMITDNLPVAGAAIEFAEREHVDLSFLVEVDCGDKRGGVRADSEDLVEVASLLHAGKRTRVLGVMTHAGHSYTTGDPDGVRGIAEQERASAVQAADRLRDLGIDVSVVSVGSTPTAVHAQSLTGVTELRCGVYAFFDLDQYGRGICSLDDIALTVLTTVIGHNRDAGIILVDAGGLALSKDTSARGFLPDAGYGYVCRSDTLERHPGLSINAVNQEHGKIAVDNADWYERLPIGTLVRVLPNHACFTAAAYSGYHVLEDGRVVGRWPRINGW